MDRTNPPPKGALLFIGSSTIRLWKTLAQDFPEQRVINRGFGGSEIVDSTYFAERVIFPYKPRMVLLRGGGNDVHAGKSPEQVFADFKEFVAKIHSKLPETDIVFISLSSQHRALETGGQGKGGQHESRRIPKADTAPEIHETYPMPLGPNGEPRPELFCRGQTPLQCRGLRCSPNACAHSAEIAAGET
jgi:hypothetical protein